MAESAVSFLLEQLSTLIAEEAALLGGLGTEIQYIRDELEHIRAFLRAAEANEETDQQLQAWVKQVRDVAYDAEDILDEFMLRFANRHGDGFIGRIRKIYKAIKNLRARHRIASEIQKIRSRITNISEGYQKYATPEISSSSTFVNNRRHDFRDNALLLEEADLVGIEQPKQQLISWLLDGHSGLKVHSVVGMGGLGKTTLVKRVYDDKAIKKHFNYHVWITVSESFIVDELLKDAVQQLLNKINQPPPPEFEAMNTNRLKEFINNFLQDKMYVVVLDDVWEINAWEFIKYAFPRNNCGSRVVITSRFDDIGRTAGSDTGGNVYNLKPLSEEESWTLFCKKTFHGSSCPAHLTKISNIILKRCEGLPLAIVVLGGVLATKNSTEEWENFHRNLGAELEGNSKLESMTRLLSLSYYDLPYYLKTCLLYVSIFPDDATIAKMRLIRLWAAEGFLHEQGERTREEVGEDYFDELVSRSLIQVATTTTDGRPKTCRMHDIIRHIILSKLTRQNIATIVGNQVTRWPDKVRRLAIQNVTNSRLEINRFQHLRSVLLLGSTGSQSNQCFPDILSGGSKLLKVLDLRRAQLESVPDEVFKLYQLKYLSLRGTKVKVIPKSIGKLQNLETLDLKNTSVTELPAEILNLQNLRHLLVYSYGRQLAYKPFGSIQSFKAPYKVGRLSNLQKICYIEAGQTDKGTKVVKQLGKLTRLRRLGIAKLRREDGKDLCSSLEKLTNLHSLNIVSIEEDEILDLQYSMFPTPQFLRTLELMGRLEKVPEWIPSLHGLTRLFLRWNRLKDDPLQYLQDLPNLVQLELSQAYDGENLWFKAGKFQKLKKLWLERLQGLRQVQIEEDAIPLLEQMVIWDCKLLEEVPVGIELLKKLQELEFSDMADELVTPLKNRNREVGDYSKIAHIPKIYIGNFVNGRWRGGLL